MGDGALGYADYTLAGFSDALASNAPVPGGGSASAVAASLAASLLVMVARLSTDRPRYAAYAATHERAIAAGEAARHRFLELADEDATAYAAFGAARKLPKDTPELEEVRSAAIRLAAQRAAEVPLEVVRHCEALVQVIESLTGRSNVNAASDLDVAALLAQAAARGAGANVIINLPSVEDAGYTGTALADLEGWLHEIEAIVADVHSEVRSGSLREAEAEAE
jgi:formiminotetrahydrofolate cyclodeaminase